MRERSRKSSADKCTEHASKEILGGRFGYFLFFLLGGAERGVRGAGRGAVSRFFIQNPREGGCLPGEGAGGRGAGMVSAGNSAGGGG